MTGEQWMTIAVGLTVAVVFLNGCTDAPNAIASLVTTGGMTMGRSAGWAALFNFLGVIVMYAVSPAVAYSISGIINLSSKELSPAGLWAVLCSSLTAIILWSAGAWLFGIPTSESHSLVAALTGAALALRKGTGGSSVVRWNVWLTVMAGLLFSLLLGFASAYLLCFYRERRRTNVRRRRQMGAAMAMAFLHGAQDGQKFLGIFLLAVQAGGAELSSSWGGRFLAAAESPWKGALVCAAVMGTGTALGGRRIVEKIGREMVSLSPAQGCAADQASAVCLLMASLLGYPVSTTHVKTAALLGAGLCGKGHEAAEKRVVGQLLLTWLVTFPGCLLLGYGLCLGMMGR